MNDWSISVESFQGVLSIVNRQSSNRKSKMFYLMKKISISQIKEVAQQAYEQVKGNTDGKNADYIPYLANIDKNLFGISICLLNGQKITIGDYNYRFGIESVSKVHTAILVLRQYGAQKILI